MLTDEVKEKYQSYLDAGIHFKRAAMLVKMQFELPCAYKKLLRLLGQKSITCSDDFHMKMISLR